MEAPSVDNPHPTWTTARKDMVGTSLGSSRLWFTIAEGIVTEVYYPRIDTPQIRDLGFIIADDQGFWVELRRMNDYEVRLAGSGVPAVEIVHRHPRFTFTIEVCPVQRRDVLLIRCRLDGDAALRPYALLAARLGDDASHDLAWVARHRGRTVMWAEQGPFGIALCAADESGLDAWKRCSVGCLEASDGWQDFNRNGRMTWQFESAGPGAVAMMGELPRDARLALGMAMSREAAATLAVSSLADDFDAEWAAQKAAWESWHAGHVRVRLDDGLDPALAISATVLKVHEDRTYRGAAVASLSIPWGDASESRGGYHLVWPRDLVETAGAFVALREWHGARDVLRYLVATQQEDGGWYQNQWLGGKPFWQGIQLDEVAFPIVLAAMLSEHDQLDGIPVRDMVVRALGFVARHGPSTDQDRWEENAGINAFTLTVAISALVEGSALLEGEAAAFALKLADWWNASIEDWLYVTGTPLAREHAVAGYYVRTAPVDRESRLIAHDRILAVKNRQVDPGLPAHAQVSTDFLQLVRFGLRAPGDAAVRDSVRVADALLKVDTPSGPAWHRYNGDGYGEHEDGSAFDGTGVGRAWPLLTGERGHYALVAGEDPLPYLKAMMAMSSPLGMLPEQVWDRAPVAGRRLEPGRPSGSAMPLVWAHAEFIKLCLGRREGRPVDRPARTWARYGGTRPRLDYAIWGPNVGLSTMGEGCALTVATTEPALVHWGTNGWREIADVATTDTGLGLHVAELPTRALAAGETIQFTFQWRGSGQWEGRDHEVKIGRKDETR